MTVITRFAPSPTGYLHIGGARTALFNYLFAKHQGGRFLLRIEDTDRARSTQEAVDTIIDSMKWLQLDWDEEIVYQFARAERHAAVARKLLEEGKAYYCYCSPEELEKMREEAKANNLPPRYNGYWRDRDAAQAPAGVAPVIRFKAPQTGETHIDDLVQGPVTLQNTQLDDMVLLRADGTPTYMLSVVVDDHDMNITHIIRGDDHLTNAFRQYHLYQACGWDVPAFAHIPLIHGPDGAKLSKRHGALGAESYRALGFLPEAMCNYLLRLGWSHGDDEIISREQAIEWFNIDAIGRSPARFDLAKLTNLNAHYMREADNGRLLQLCQPLIEEKLGVKLTPAEIERISQGMNGLKQRAKTVLELADNSLIYIRVAEADEKAQKFISEPNQRLVEAVIQDMKTLASFTEQDLDAKVRETAERLGEKLGNIAQPLRVALTGSTVSPSVFEVMAVLGKEETIKRLESFIRL
ncbi:glutamate--tRNA ligase [Candidatus Odyssella thessalonicensis]|uniref:glutamate--tRNA ligase n=1 Tax=Candidatus Odyssella thessalonicensis TaxID=84647 RepID=UPI000225BDBE|nr:glutamate--tRNA ligase [Candidatus Odyssella thessalonicensis]